MGFRGRRVEFREEASCVEGSRLRLGLGRLGSFGIGVGHLFSDPL